MTIFSRGVLLCAGLVLMLAAFAPATGYAKDAVPEFWSTRCNTPKDAKDTKVKFCEVFQRLAVTKKGEKTPQRLVEVAIGFPPEKKGLPRGVVVLPLGISLDAPVKLQLDEKTEFTFHARYCQIDGCYAYIDLSAAQIEQMKKLDKMTLKVPALGGQVLSIIMSLKGFGPALDKIKS